MVLLAPLLYGLLALLDSNSPPNSPPTDLSVRGHNQCRKDTDCSAQQKCQRVNGGYLACRDACEFARCGPNAVCSVTNHQTSCACMPNHKGDPYDFQNGCQNADYSLPSSDSICPDDAKCSQACEEHPHFKSKGTCLGPARETCSCGPPVYVSEETIDIEPEVCDEDKCKKKCAAKPLKLIGVCDKKRICRCVLHSTES